MVVYCSNMFLLCMLVNARTLPPMELTETMELPTFRSLPWMEPTRAAEFPTDRPTLSPVPRLARRTRKSQSPSISLASDNTSGETPACSVNIYSGTTYSHTCPFPKSGTLILLRCTFNECPLPLDSILVTATECTFSKCSNRQINGGHMTQNTSWSLIATNCAFEDCGNLQINGGHMTRNETWSLAAINCAFSKCSDMEMNGGGTIENRLWSLTAINCTFSKCGNVQRHGGFLIQYRSCPVTNVNCIFTS